MEIKVKHNIKSFMSDLKKFQRVDIPKVNYASINETAAKVVHMEKLGMKKHLDRPRPQTVKSLFFIPAKRNKMFATVTVRDWAQDFLHRNIEGGIRRVRNTAVPTINAKLNQYGNIPGRRNGVVKRGQFIAKIGDIYGVWERNKKTNELKIIHRFETNPRYDAKYPFYRIARKTTNTFFPRNYTRIAEYYIKRAGYRAR